MLYSVATLFGEKKHLLLLERIVQDFGTRTAQELTTRALLAWSCTGIQKLLKRSWWNPLDVLTWSGTGPCEKILWRSCWKPPKEVRRLLVPLFILCRLCRFLLHSFVASDRQNFVVSEWQTTQEVLALRSWRSSALVLVWKFLLECS